MAKGYPKTSLVIQSTDTGGKLVSKAVPYVALNNEGEAYNFAQAANALTGNTLKKTNIVVTRSLFDENQFCHDDLPLVKITVLDETVPVAYNNEAATMTITLNSNATCVTKLADSLYRVVLPVSFNEMAAPFMGGCYVDEETKSTIAICRSYNMDDYYLVALIDTAEANKELGVPYYYETIDSWEVVTQARWGYNTKVGTVRIRFKEVDGNG